MTSAVNKGKETIVFTLTPEENVAFNLFHAKYMAEGGVHNYLGLRKHIDDSYTYDEDLVETFHKSLGGPALTSEVEELALEVKKSMRDVHAKNFPDLSMDVEVDALRSIVTYTKLAENNHNLI